MILDVSQWNAGGLNNVGGEVRELLFDSDVVLLQEVHHTIVESDFPEFHVF